MLIFHHIYLCTDKILANSFYKSIGESCSINFSLDGQIQMVKTRLGVVPNFFGVVLVYSKQIRMKTSSQL